MVVSSCSGPSSAWWRFVEYELLGIMQARMASSSRICRMWWRLALRLGLSMRDSIGMTPSATGYQDTGCLDFVENAVKR